MRKRAPTPPPAHPLRSGESVAGTEWESVLLGSDDEIESPDTTPCTPPQEWRKCGRCRVGERRAEKARQEEEGEKEEGDDDDEDEDGWPLMMIMMRLMMMFG